MVHILYQTQNDPFYVGNKQNLYLNFVDIFQNAEKKIGGKMLHAFTNASLDYNMIFKELANEKY